MNVSPEELEVMVDRVMAQADACPVCFYDGLWPYRPDEWKRDDIRALLRLALGLPA